MKKLLIATKTAFLLLLAVSCQKSVSDDRISPTSADPDDLFAATKGLSVRVVHVVGYQGKTARYWRNGVVTNLTDGSWEAKATGIALSGTDVYISGWEDGLLGSKAKYWKNGVEVNLTQGISSAHANAIAVVGQDVYVAGYEYNSAGKSVAKYWKNGAAISLTNGSYQAAANDIFVDEGDIYVAGYEYNAAGNAVAKYWKNKVATSLTNNNNQTAMANAIIVVQSNVYVAGWEIDLVSPSDEVAKYWKNGVPVSLNYVNTSYAVANDICVIGNDVHVAGVHTYGSIDASTPAYWKNGQLLPLGTPFVNPGHWTSKAHAVTVKGNDAYVAGLLGNGAGDGGEPRVATYWLNGNAILLGNPQGSSACLDIAVEGR